jgi:hypothetical protein
MNSAKPGTAMRPIIWLASYPRSGNTYLRALLINYLHANGEPVPINQFPHFTFGEHDDQLLSELTGKAAADRELDDLWRARPVYFDRLRQMAGSGPLFVKTHTVDGVYKDVLAFDFQPDDRVIHLVRHPGDVAISSADFYGVDLEKAIERATRPGLFIDGRPEGSIELPGAWGQNVRAWLNETRVPVLTLLYPDLSSAPAEALTKVLSFIGLDVDASRVKDAVDFTRFDRLRAQEAATGFVEGSSLSTSGRFFREGRTRQWPEVLSEDQARRLLAPNQSLIDELGL